MNTYRIDISTGEPKPATVRFWLDARCWLFAVVRGWIEARRDLRWLTSRPARQFSVTQEDA